MTAVRIGADTIKALTGEKVSTIRRWEKDWLLLDKDGLIDGHTFFKEYLKNVVRGVQEDIDVNEIDSWDLTKLTTEEMLARADTLALKAQLLKERHRTFTHCKEALSEAREYLKAIGENIVRELSKEITKETDERLIMPTAIKLIRDMLMAASVVDKEEHTEDEKE